MKTIKKIVAAFLAGVIAATALCAVAGAESMLNAKTTLKNGKKTTISCDGTNSKTERYYKFKITKNGKFTIDYILNCVQSVDIYLCNSDGEYIECEGLESKTGRCDYYAYHGYTRVKSDIYTTKLGSGKLTYNLKKGTYYLMAKCTNFEKGTFKFTAKFPTSDEGTSDAKIDALTLTVKKGTSLSFGTMITGTADPSDIKWTTSDKKVATVSSKGVVKAVAKGTATITAKIGSSSVKIIIKVTA